MRRCLNLLMIFIIIVSVIRAESAIGSDDGNRQEINKLKLDSLFSLIDKNNKGMGVISVFRDGNQIYSNAMGFADIEKVIRNSEATKFRIGSISKSFTAAIIMQLVDENKLTLETGLNKFYPEIKNSEKITVEHLLRHRSGIHNFTSDPEYLAYNQTPKSEEELMEIFSKLESDFEPDSRFSYSNTGYVLLSLISQKIEGEKFSDILKKRITEPLKLKNTYLGGRINTSENEAYSYNPADNSGNDKKQSDDESVTAKNWQLSTETDLSIPLGAGGIVSTPLELNIFFNALFSGKVVSQASLERMKKIVDGYGLGIFFMPFNNKKGLGHTGGIDGFESMAGFYESDNLSFAYCGNGVSFPQNEIIIGVLSILGNLNYSLPDFKPAIKLNSEDLDQYLGVYGNATFPLKITISKKETESVNDAVLVAQATGQPSFTLECYEKDKFQFEAAGIKLEFLPAEKKMILRQRGMTFELQKEN